MQQFEELKDECNKLAFLITKAEQEQNHDEQIKLKKQLYTNKLLMIELITIEEKRNGITARELKKIVEMRPTAIRYETGIRPLDDKFKGGIELGTFVQLAGESGVGKTHLTLEVLTNIAQYTKSVFFNFEMGDTRIIKRLKNLIKEEQQWDNLIIDNDSRELDTLCNEITLYANDGVKFFTIDSKMKINVNSAEADHQKFSKISKRLAELSQKQDIIIFLINQMNEEDIKHKRLAFKGSGDQKYDADIALFYVRDDEGQRRLICNKNRQDEYEFSIDLKLNAKGQTVDAHEIYPVHEVAYEMPAV